MKKSASDIIKERLSYEIENSGLKKCEIAEMIGVKPTMITAYIKTKKMPSLETFSKICLKLNLDANYVLGLRDFEN